SFRTTPIRWFPRDAKRNILRSRQAKAGSFLGITLSGLGSVKKVEGNCAMAKNVSRRSVPRNIYGDEIGAYIEECRQFVARARRQEVIVEDSASLFKTKGRSGKSANSRKNAAAEQDLTARQEALRKLETDLAKREVELIERELKCYALQQEVDR